MADPTKLIPWQNVEGDPRWNEAPTYLKDEYLAKWEEYNQSQVAGDTALAKRITDHAAMIRGELNQVRDMTLAEGVKASAGAVQAVDAMRAPMELDRPETVTASPETYEAAQKASLGAVQALDMMGLASKFDWTDVRDKIAVERLQDALKAKEYARVFDEEGSDAAQKKGIGGSAFDWRREADYQLAKIPEDTVIGRQLAQSRSDELTRITGSPWTPETAAEKSEKERFQEWLKANGQEPSAFDAFASQLTGSLLEQGASVMRNFAPSGQAFYEASNKVAEEGHGAKEMAQSAGDKISAQIGRGAGSFAGMMLGNPAGKIGLAVGALRGAAEASEQTLAQGGTPKEAQEAAISTLPALAAYMFGGKLAASAAGKMLGAEASVAARTALSTGASAASNVATGSIIRAMEGQNWVPTAENLTMDTLFAIAHGRGEYKDASKVAKERAETALRVADMAVSRISQAAREMNAGVYNELPKRPTEQPVEPTTETQPVSEAAPAQEAPPAPSETGPSTPIGVSPAEVPGVRYDGVTSFPNDPVKFYSFTDSESIPGKAVSITLEGEKPPTPDQIKTAMEAKLRQFREAEAPAPTEEASPVGLNKEASDLLASIDSGGAAPAFISNNLRKIASENGVTITDQMRPEDVIGELRKRASAPVETPAKQAEEAAPTPENPAEATPPPVEPPKAASESAEPMPEGATSIKNAQVDQERAKRGMPAAMEPLKRTFQNTWDMAMREIEATPGRQDGLIAELEKKPRAINDIEDALLLHRQVELQEAYDKAAKDMADAHDSGDSAKLEDAKSRLGFATDALYKVYEIGKRAGTETGRGLQARKMLAKLDYTLASMLNRKRASKGGEKLSPEEAAEVKEQSEQIQKTDTAFEERKAELEAEHSGKGVDEVIKSASEPVKEDPAVTPLVERITAYLDSRANAARIRLRSKIKQANTGVDVTILADVVDIAASKLAKKGVEFASWSAEMIRDFGEGIRDYLQPAWQQASQQIDKAVEAVIEPAKRTKAKRAVKAPIDEAARVSKIDAAIGEQVKDGDTIEQLGGFVRRLAESFVKQGVKEREPLIDAVHGVLEKHFPGITRREAMDAISGYGKFTPLSKDPVKVQLRDLSGQMQQVAKLEDIRAKVPLQKTGKEQRQKSREEARLEREVEEAKKRFGVVVTDPETQLKSTMDGVKTRLRNQIRDITYEIETGNVSGAKEPILLDSEATALRALRDRLRSTLKEIEGPKEMSKDQRVKASERALEDSIATYEQRIRDNELATPRKGKTEVTSPRIEELKVQRDALKAQLEELRTNDSALAEERKAERIVKSIEQAEKELAGGTSEKAKAQGPETALVAEAREQLAGLREQIRNRNASSPEAIAKKQDAAERALEKSIEDMDRRIQQEDFAAKKTNTTPDSPKMEQLKAERAAMRKLYMELKDAGKPKLTREEIAMKALKSRLASQTADLRSRASRGDFEKAKREPLDITKDKDAMRLKAENTKAKEEFEEGRMKDEWARMGKLEKAYAIGKETLNLPRAILSSMDVSGFGRQGGFLAAAHPSIAKNAAKEMFLALKSEKDFRRNYEEIVNRNNAPLYERSGLYIAPISETKLGKMEEAIMSKFADKIPGIHASNRAYITVLNKLRADSFDQLKARLESKGRPMNQKELEAIANYINVATGRGSLGSGKIAQAAELLATIFFSPRLMASRFQLLVGQPLWRGSMRTRALIAQEYARALGGYGVIAALGMLAGGKLGDDPTSSDFGKLIFGNTRVDFLSGLVQPTVFLSRMKAGEKTKASGEKVPIAGEDIPYKGDTRFDVAEKFVRSKMSPVAGTVWDIADNWTNYNGEPVTPGSAALNLVTPLPFRDIGKIMEDQGIPKGTALYLLSLLGAGIQVHKKD